MSRNLPTVKAKRKSKILKLPRKDRNPPAPKVLMDVIVLGHVHSASIALARGCLFRLGTELRCVWRWWEKNVQKHKENALLLVVRMLLVAMPGATNSVLVTSSSALAPSSFLFVVISP